MMKKLVVLSMMVIVAGCGGSNNEDKCQGVTCNDPDPPVCKDANTLIEYASPGTCNPSSGKCEYQGQERACAQGCQDGACVGEKSALGYVAVFEADVLWFAGAQWFTGVGGYFAEEPSYYRFLPHQLRWFCKEEIDSGDCKLYDSCQRVGPAERLEDCLPPCPEDQWCAGTACQPLPRHFSLGTINVTGTKSPLALEPDNYDRYLLESPPADLFDAGAEIQMSAAGGELGPLSLSARGVAPLAPAAQSIELLDGQEAVFSWTPAGDSSRVMLVALGGLHDPTPPVGLVCDTGDAAGTLTIPAALVDQFRSRTMVIQKPSYAMRYTREMQQPFGQEVEFIVGSVVGTTICLSPGCI